MNPAIFHIKTGGTIGGCVPEYLELEQLSKLFSDPVDIDKYIVESLKIAAPLESKTVCHKDSREVTDADRKAIANLIVDQHKAGINKFLITHGTYTMPDTGKYLSGNLTPEVLKEVRIVITGSMYPWNIVGSDAPMNIGAAIYSLIEDETPEVLIVIHGQSFDPEKVKKDAEKLLFSEDA